MTHTADNRPLDEVIDELFYSSEEINPELVKKYIELYPQFERDLLDFAVHWATSVAPDDMCLHEQGMSETNLLSLQSKVLKRLYETGLTDADQPSNVPDAWKALAAVKGAKALRAASEALDLGDHRILVSKILNGAISNVPRSVLVRLANYLNKPVDTITLALRSRSNLSYSFKASGKPEAPSQETWEEAIARLDADPIEKKRLLCMDDEELSR